MMRPAFFLAVAVLIGAVLGRVAARPPIVGMAAGFALTALAIILAFRAFAPERDRLRAAVGRVVLAAFVCFAFAQQSFVVQLEKVGRNQVDQLAEKRADVRLRGIVATEPSARTGRTMVVLRDVEVMEGSGPAADAESTATGKLACRIQVSLYRDADEQWKHALPVRGQGIEVTGRVFPPPQAPHADLFDYGAYLRTRGVGATMSVWNSEKIARLEHLDRPTEAKIFGALMRWRRQTLARLDRSMPPEHAGVMRAMLLGETGQLTPQIREIFVRTGCGHLFAVSGLHTALLAFIIFRSLCFLFVPPRAAAWTLVVFLAVYCALVGFRAPVLRASIMAFCLALPYLARRSVDSLTVLSVALFFTVLVNPLAPFRIDFQFSYLCALGLIVLGPPLRESFCAMYQEPLRQRLVVPLDLRLRTLRKENRELGRELGLLNIEPNPDRDAVRRCEARRERLAGAMDDLKRVLGWRGRWVINSPLLPFAAGWPSVTIAAQLVALPLLSVCFHRFSLIGFAANMVMVPLAWVLLLAGWLLSLLGGGAPGIEAALGSVASILVAGFLLLARLFAAVPWASVPLQRFPWWLIGAYYLWLFSGPYLRRLRAPGAVELGRTRMLIRLAVVAALLAWWPLLARAPWISGDHSGGLGVTMLDVGQGDCFLLRLPNGRALMVDAAPAYDGGLMVDFLHSRGIGELSGLLLTHPDSDHIKSAPGILDGIFVRRLFLGSGHGYGETETQKAVLAAVERNGVPVSRLARGDEIAGARGVRLDVLHPPPDRTYSGRNDASVVLLAEYGDMTFLLTGDAEAGAEREMVAFYGDEGLEAEVLKVAHHGSRSGTTSEFLDAVRPEAALISVSKRNRYFHPAPQVVQRLEASGAQIWSTALHGTVEFRTDGRRLWIKPTRRSLADQ